MWVSDDHRFCFIHVQKTGGQSIRRLLKDRLPDFASLGGTHDTAVRGRHLLGPATFDDYTSAAFVRNPWDRLVSWYAMIAQSDRDLKMHHYVHDNSHDFPSFVRNCTATIHDHDGEKSFTRNQVDYLVDADGRMLVDFVGRFETLDHDATRLFRSIGLLDARLPHVNATTHGHYSASYTDDLADVVARRFTRDIEHFGYEFERSTT